MKEKIEYVINQIYPKILTIFEHHVKINSYTFNPQGIDALSTVIAELFATLDFTAEYIPSVNNLCGNHLILERKGNTDHSIVCVSHLDTVYSPEEEEKNEFYWRRNGDRIYGPGVNDIKGGTIVLYLVLYTLYEIDPELLNKITWKILLNASEEVNSDDFAHLGKKYIDSHTRACLVFEAGNIEDDTYYFVTARKGRVVFSINVKGISAHAGVDHKNGISAVVCLSDMITRIHHLNDYAKDVTINIGFMNGGESLNRVPDYAEASGEIRAYNNENIDEVIEHIEKIAMEMESTYKGSSVDFCIERNVPCWSDNEKSEALLQWWKQAGKKLGFTICKEKRGGLSDGNYFYHLVPTIDGLGPSGAYAHCSVHNESENKFQEYVDEPSIIQKTILNCYSLYIFIKDL